MSRLLAAALAAFLSIGPAFAANSPPFPPLAPSATTDATNAANISSGTLPAGRLPALTGDCTTTVGTAATSCTKTGGVAFAPSATTDTTNAANLSSGTLLAARLPTSVATSGANSNITSLTGLSTPLPASEGGTGNTGGAWTSFTPAINFTSGTGTGFTSPVGKYLQVGKSLSFHAQWVENYTAAPTVMSITLPNSLTASATSIQFCLVGDNATAATGIGFLQASGTAVSVINTTGGQLASSTGQTIAITCSDIEVQ